MKISPGMKPSQKNNHSGEHAALKKIQLSPFFLRRVPIVKVLEGVMTFCMSLALVCMVIILSWSHHPINDLSGGHKELLQWRGTQAN